MDKLSSGQKRLIAEFLANIGVAWFAGGVIGAFTSSPKTLFDITVPLLWGTAFSAGFLRIAMYFTKGVRS